MNKNIINQTGVGTNSPYFENIDGLRAIAAFLVIFFHLCIWFQFPSTDGYNKLRFFLTFGWSGGELGVTFFFVLSGFLITYLAFNEQSKSQTFNIPKFYVRRILRIWPLYYLTVIIGFIIYPLIVKLYGAVYVQEKASLLMYLLFLANFDHIYNNYPSSGILGVQWSVCIEEQFYIIWPIFFSLFSRRKMFPFLVILIIIFSEYFYMYNSSFAIRYYHLFSSFRYLAFGGLLSYLCFFKNEWITFLLSKVNKFSTFLIYAICFLLLLFKQRLLLYGVLNNVSYHLLVYFYFSFIIIEQNYSKNSFFKMGSFRILNWFGKISYGLYLFHMIAIYVVLSLFNANSSFVLWKILLSILLSTFLSYFSYNYFESFFLKLKKNFQ